MKYTIGIDLGGTTMTAGLVDEAYNIVGKITRPTRLPRPAQDLEQALADLCRAVAKDCKIDFADVSYVGIGTPGSVNFTTGFVGYNTNFGYYDWNLGPDLEALLGCKVYVENDANAAAFGEYIAGGAKGFKDAVVITLGTGIGSGIILGGKILRGFNFAAGRDGPYRDCKGWTQVQLRPLRLLGTLCFLPRSVGGCPRSDDPAPREHDVETGGGY